MLVVITAENSVDNEVQAIKKLANYPILIHIRKPKWSKEELKRWLTRFTNLETSKMMLHQHHELSTLFKIKGLHYTEQLKAQPDLKFALREYKKFGLTLSASFHDLKEAEGQILFDYALLSPVFNSISKPNYKGKLFQIQRNQKPIIALGGINGNNIAKTKSLGYDGIAVLGNIWKSNNPINAFDDLFKVYKRHY